MRNDGLDDRQAWTRLEAPRYLLGVGLAIWGMFSGHPVLGFSAGLVVESHRWLRWRWAFSDQDYVRVWNLCVALFLTVAVFQIVGHEGDHGRWRVTRVFQTWMPLLLLPMMWAQRFSSGAAIPFLTFSLVARRKRLYDERAGRGVAAPRRTALDYFYFAVLLLSIGAVGWRAPELGDLWKMESWRGLASVSLVYVAATFLLGWALLARVPRRTWAPALVVLLGAAYFGHHVHYGLRVLHAIVENKTMEWITGRFSGEVHRSRTEFGEVGEVKLSNKVFWRVRLIDGPKERLLPESIYTSYGGRMWVNPKPYRELKKVTRVESRNQWEIRDLAIIDSTAVMELRGHVSARQPLLPRLEETALVFDLEASELSRNPVGSLVADPDYSSVKYTVYAGPRESSLSPSDTATLGPSDEGDEEDWPLLEAEPHADIDLSIDEQERDQVMKIVEGLGVTGGASPRQRVEAVEAFFSDPAQRFTYSRYLPQDQGHSWSSPVSPVTWFLREKGRRGHCEYYATSTVMLLRGLGVPARYVVGYAMEEKDRRTGEFLLRGTHRHAWARAWLEDEQRWVNVDTTPANWFEQEERSLTGWERFRERWNYWMLSWSLWRRDENKGLLWTVLPLLLAGGLLIIVVLRLVRGLRKSRKLEAVHASGGRELDIRGRDSVWYEVEKILSALHGSRPPWQSVASWGEEMRNRAPADWSDSLRRLVDLHYRYRFDPEGLSDDEARQFSALAGELRDEVRKTLVV